MADEAARQQREQFARAREAERGDYDSDRGDYDSDRGDYDSDRGDYDSDRGDYDSDRGDYDSDRGVYTGGEPFAGPRDANRVIADIFRKTVGLGGHLIVAFVAPIGSSSPAAGRRLRRRRFSAQSESAAANAHVSELIEQIRQNRSRRPDQRAPAQTAVDDSRTVAQSSVNAQTSAQSPRPPTGQ